MQRPITAYRQDEENHWVALLDCGHPQHVRHNPPQVSRPWVLTEAGRASHLGMMLNCVRCERFELPGHFIPYKKTPVFTHDTVPAGLLKDHSTGPGTWARIHVMEGQLRYFVPIWDLDTVLSPDQPGIVVPEVLHSVAPLGQVRFYVEFHRAPIDASSSQ